MTSFLAVSLPPDSCPDKTGEFLSVPIGSRKVRLETDWKITGIVRKHPTGIRPQRTSQKRLGNGRKRRKPGGSDTEIAETGRLFEVPATGLIDLGMNSPEFQTEQSSGALTPCTVLFVETLHWMETAL